MRINKQQFQIVTMFLDKMFQQLNSFQRDLDDTMKMVNNIKEDIIKIKEEITNG